MFNSFKIFSLFANKDNPSRIVALGYFSYVLIGVLLLSLPFFQKASSITFLDNLFISVSAVSTTGLVTISVSDCYNFWGQLVVLILIQLGGIGYMTLGSFLVLAFRGRISLDRHRIHQHILNIADGVSTRQLIKTIIYYSFAVEAIGALLLFILFKIEELPNALWSAVFHSISAFCTAGFSLYNNSLEAFNKNTGINLVISVLCILGAIGFIIVYDIWNNRIKEKRQISLISKMILQTTFILIIFGTAILFFFEPGITGKPFLDRVLASFFQSMNALTTAGFNSIPLSNLTMFSYLIITFLMVIGASPSGTGGGLKTTTFAALIGVMKSALKGTDKVKLLNRTIPYESIWMAISILCFYLLVLFISTFFILMQDSRFNFQQVVFEVTSALGTVGLSAGITSGLNNFEKIIITITMFIGRIGPLSFGMALFLHDKDSRLIVYPEEDLVV